MPTQPTTKSDVDSRPPWSPISVSIISFVLPAGGAILTIANLHRLKVLDAQSAQRTTAIAYIVLALGYTGLLLSASHKGSTGIFATSDAGGSTVLSVGVAIVSFLVQRDPFRAWRKSHEQVRTSPWLGGVGRALIYTVIAFAIAFPFVLAGVALGLGGGGKL